MPSATRPPSARRSPGWAMSAPARAGWRRESPTTTARSAFSPARRGPACARGLSPGPGVCAAGQGRGARAPRPGAGGRTPDRRARVVAPCVRAQAALLGHQGRFEAAAALYERLAAGYQRAHDPSGRALILAWAAAIYREDLADYARAQRTLELAQADAAASHNRYADVITRLYLGQIALTLNDYATARSHLDDAVEAAKAVGDGEALAVSRSWRALVHLAVGDLDRARQESLETLDFFRREGDLENPVRGDPDPAPTSPSGRGTGPKPSARSTARRPCFAASGAGPGQVAQGYERGRLALYRGYLGSPNPPSPPRWSDWTPPPTCSATRSRPISRTCVPAAAISPARSRSSPPRRTSSTAGGPASAPATSGSPPFRRMRRPRTTATPAWRRCWRPWRRRPGRGGVRSGRAAPCPRAGRPADPGSGAGIGRGPAEGPVTRGAELLSVADIVRHLPEHTALLEFVTGAHGSPTTVFVLSFVDRRSAGAGPRASPADSLTGAIARFLALVSRDTDLSVPRPSARGHGAAAARRRAARPRDHPVVIIPDGVLHRVPWDALRLADGHEVSRALRHRPGALRHDRDRAADGGQAAAVGAVRACARLRRPGVPHRRRAAGSGSYQAAFASAGGLPKLPGSGAEAKAVAGHADADVLLGLRGQRAPAQDALAQPVHRAPLRHPRVVDERVDRPDRAGADAGRTGEDGFVTPGDLGRLRLTADLVVLRPVARRAASWSMARGCRGSPRPCSRPARAA